MLTPDQVSAYHRDGFLVVPEAIPTELIDEACAVADELIERSRTVRESDNVYDLEPGHGPGHPRVRRIKLPTSQHPVFDRILRHGNVLDAAEDIFASGAGVRLNTSKLNTKTGANGSAAPIAWHQDFAFYPQTNRDVTAIGVYLDDSTEENGCMLMVPGSHHGPVYDHHRDGYFVGAVDPERHEVDFSTAVSVEAPRGAISLHHGHMLHASRPNRSPKPRRLLLFELLAADAWPLLGVSDVDDFNARLLREGRSGLTPRSEDVRARIPLPKPERAGSIFETQQYAAAAAFAG